METVESLERAIGVLDGTDAYKNSALMLEYAQFLLAADLSNGVSAIVAAALAEVESTDPSHFQEVSKIIYGANTESGTDTP